MYIMFSARISNSPCTIDSCSVPLSGSNDNDAVNLASCTGECDADEQCASGLFCFQRESGEPIPGCTGTGEGDDWDYCYDPACVDLGGLLSDVLVL